MAVPHPIPANQIVNCQTQTVSGASWAPGVSRLTTFKWTPIAGSVPLGDKSLVAWSDIAGDAPQFTASVILDNNRGQRNITVKAAAEPLPPSNIDVQ